MSSLRVVLDAGLSFGRKRQELGLEEFEIEVEVDNGTFTWDQKDFAENVAQCLESLAARVRGRAYSEPGE